MRSGPRRAGTKADERERAAAQLTTLATRTPQALPQRVKLFLLRPGLRLPDVVASALEGTLDRARQGRKAAR